MKLIRKKVVVLFTLLSIVNSCYAQESGLRNSKPKFTSDFVKAVNSGQYLLAAMQIDRYDFDYRLDSLDRSIDFDKFIGLIEYVDTNSLVSDEQYFQLWSYVAKANLRTAMVVFYNQNDINLARDLVDDAINIYTQLDGDTYGIDYASSNCLKGKILLALGDTIEANHLLWKAVKQYKMHNVIGEDYIEALFYLGVSYPIRTYDEGFDCELTEIWDECYYALLEAKKQGKIPIDYYLKEETFLWRSIHAYVACGLKHKWLFEFDDAEMAFQKAIERSEMRKQYTLVPIESLGDINHYLIECRKLRMQTQTDSVSIDIFMGEKDCDWCTPYHQFIHSISGAQYAEGVSDDKLCASFMHEAYKFRAYIDSVPCGMADAYYTLCLSVKKDSFITSFIDEDEIRKSFDFLFLHHPTILDSLVYKLRYANSLIPLYLDKAYEVLNNVDSCMMWNDTRLDTMEFYPPIKMLYLTELSAFALMRHNKAMESALENENYTDFPSDDIVREQITTTFRKVSDIWKEFKENEFLKDNIDVHYTIPAVILLSASEFSTNDDLFQDWALEYLRWRKPYLSYKISMLPESKRYLWLEEDKLKAEGCLYEYMKRSIAEKKTVPMDIMEAQLDNEIFINELLFKCSQSVSKYVENNHDETARILYNELKEKKKRYTNFRQQNVDNIPLLDSILNIERVLAETTKEYRIKKNVDNSPTWSAVRNRLQDNEVAIEFVSFGKIDSYGAFVLRKSMSNPAWIPLTNPFMAQSIEDLQSYFQKRAKGDEYGYYLTIPDSVKDKLFSEFYTTIWQPLTGYINEGDVVFYAPKGMLHYFPLQSVMAADSTYLSDKYDLRMVSSIGNLVDRNISLPAYSGIALYGGIYYDELYNSTEEYSYTMASNDRGHMNYLPYSKKEITSISTLCKERGVPSVEYSGSEATEFSIGNLSGMEYSIIHFATHNYYLQEIEAQYQTALDKVGLCLYKANNTLKSRGQFRDPSNDGLLTASEISNIDLNQADLVVLSACSTGLGEITGDGLIGLQRGFKMAGVKSIMMSLWPVDDAATYLLMTEFYRNYLGGKTKTKSLREAQRYLRNYEQNGEKIFADPKYWAAFVLLDALD